MLKTPFPNQRKLRSHDYSNQCQRELSCICENWKLGYLLEETRTVMVPLFQNMLHSAGIIFYSPSTTLPVVILYMVLDLGLLHLPLLGVDVTTTVRLLLILPNIHTSVSLGLQDSLSTGSITQSEFSIAWEEWSLLHKQLTSVWPTQSPFNFPWWTYSDLSHLIFLLLSAYF